MKICYIVLTCEKYFTTRVEWQLKTMFKNVNKNDIYFLGHKMDKDNNLYSWGANDKYNGLVFKLVDFFKNMDLDYDWYVFIDDDTFVFHNRLERLLSLYNTNIKLCIGRELQHIKHTEWGIYLSGGAGTAMTKPLYQSICNLIRTSKHISDVVVHMCADICMGMWIKQISDVHVLNSERFNPELISLYDINHFCTITLHHLKSLTDFELYDTIQ